ncbi:MAG TPA: hypothetical protein VFP17_07890 [Solirubrobacterales bacterium]|nr:hypothetical protein [Solirubrobacterales bacterium]
MRLATTLVFLALGGALLIGCGGSGDSTTGAPHMSNGMPHMAGGVSMAQMRATWMRSAACRHPQGASRWGCSVGPYRCQAVVTDRGWTVDCAKPGRSIAFTVPARK